MFCFSESETLTLSHIDRSVIAFLFLIPKYKELYELRIRTAKAMARTIFTVSGENIVLLYAFQKKCKRDNVKALECAYKMNRTSEELTEVCL